MRTHATRVTRILVNSNNSPQAIKRDHSSYAEFRFTINVLLLLPNTISIRGDILEKITIQGLSEISISVKTKNTVREKGYRKGLRIYRYLPVFTGWYRCL